MSVPSSAPFSDPQAVARYAEGPPRLVPGFADLHRMTSLLLAERIPAAASARILVLGAGGGLELKALAEAHPDWTFDGIDPSAQMLHLAERMLGPLAARVRLHQGYIDVAPDGPFDGAACLLTLHFVPADERRRTLAEVRRRLRPGAPFVVAHMSIPGDDEERQLWLSRYAAFAVASGIPPEQAESGRAAVAARLSILTPEQDEALLHEAGFSHIRPFYAALTFRGWGASSPGGSSHGVP